MYTAYRCLERLETIKKMGFSNKINLILNTIDTKTKKTKLFSYPIFLDVVPTKLCNLNCIFCIQYVTERAQVLSLENFKFIAKKFLPYVTHIDFCSGGEPFLNKNFMEFLAICREYGALVNIASNGTLLSEGICRKIVENGRIKSFNFSFDGDKRETVESIRRGIDFHKVVDNMRLMAGLKDKHKREYPLVVIRFAAMRRNIEELPDLVQHASQWGIDKIKVEYLNVANNVDPNESLFYHQGLARRVFAEVSKMTRRKKIRVNLPEFFGNRSCKGFCGAAWNFIRIDPDGSVRPCYKAWDNPVGNIFESEGFFDLWNNERYRLMRKSNNGDKPYYKYCSVCSVRRGYGQESSHIKCLHDDLYKFDKE